MSDQPSSSGSNNPVQPPTSSRTVRRRRPTAIPTEEGSNEVIGGSGGGGGNEVIILKPSDVPQREPLPEYKPPDVPSNISSVPKTVPIDRLHEYHVDDTKNVILPTNISSDLLMAEAEKIKEPVSFRSTNYVDPERIREEIGEKEMRKKEESERKRRKQFGWKQQMDFIQRSQDTINSISYGCSTRIMEDSINILHVIMKAPEASIYKGGVFFFTISMNVTPDLDLIPDITFKTLMFNPNLSRTGKYDNRSLLNNHWNRNSTLDVIYKWLTMEMINLKTDIFKKSISQLEDMSQPNISHLARNDWTKFEEIARELVMKMAGGTVAKHHTVKAEMGNEYTSEHGWAVPPEEEDIDVCN
uniref:UBIQUITIN_CONJUGAT_2 domain-containing protein n=1 Tax=Caenorhabditis tropicalis TaxID=1561998 RepID=A0A1I7U605_9PELO